jgi:sugar phosphate isomerase/epimerase
MINRRQALGALAAAAALAPRTCSPAEDGEKRTQLGLVLYCCRLRRRALQRGEPPADLYQPENFLKHCRQLGAGGMQAALGVLTGQQARSLREQAEQAGLFVEAIVRPPQERKELERFDAEMQTAAAAGAQAARTTIIPGRRYEYFDSLEMFRRYEAAGRRSLELAAPVAEKHRMPLAVENHKDHRNDERVALLQHIGSEYVGACVDTGNSFALLEDPLETVRALAPWAHSVHLKDQAVQPYEDGFLLGDIPLGKGFLDLKQMIEVLRRAKPAINFSLELITRDPLRVPCLTEKYWATFPDVPGSDLARTLRTVRRGATDNLQQVSSRTPQDQLALEDQNVQQSLDYARSSLGLQ